MRIPMKERTKRREYNRIYMQKRRAEEREKPLSPQRRSNKEFLVLQKTRRAILKCINSQERENAPTFPEIREATGISESSLRAQMRVLVDYAIVYKQPNYIKGYGHFYSIYWSDEAQEALCLAEAADDQR